MSPTDNELGKRSAEDLAAVLVDHNSYMYLAADDLPEPQFRLRIKRGRDELDILMSVAGSPSLHQDLWFRTRVQGGASSDGFRGPVCFYETKLQKLAEEAQGN